MVFYFDFALDTAHSARATLKPINVLRSSGYLRNS